MNEIDTRDTVLYIPCKRLDSMLSATIPTRQDSRVTCI